MATIFALVNIPKAQQVGTSKTYAKSTDITVVSRPKYETEMDVTRAIVSGELKFGTAQAYEHARLYQRYLKQISKPKFFPKKGKTNSPASNRHMHVMFQKLG